MASTVAQVLVEFKADVGRALSAKAIKEVCDDLGYAYRDRIFNPVTIVHKFLTQVLNGNAACTALPHLMGKRFTASAYVKART